MQRQFAFCCLILGLVIVGTATDFSRADADLPGDVKAVWNVGKAWKETTPTRERICINGLWRWQPADDVTDSVPAGNWGFFKVPGSWPGSQAYNQKDCQTVYKDVSWQARDLRAVDVAWYQREITIPEAWRGRRIAVTIEYLNSYAAVHIDGRKMGEMYFPGGEVDITSACRPGSTHVLSFCVQAVPLGAAVMAFTDTGAPKRVKGTVSRRGLCGDVYLKSTPGEARVGDVKVNTSVRTWEISFDTALDDLQQGREYRLRARITDNGSEVKESSSASFTSADLTDGRFTFTAKWKPGKLWDIHTPQNKYVVQVSLVDAQGKELDTFRHVRFGFREFWIEGRDYYLNGTRIYLFVMPTDNALLGAAWANYDSVRESLLRLKSFGVNAVYTHNYGCQPGQHQGYAETLRAADDVGMLVGFSQPHFGHYDWKLPDAEKANGYARHAEFYVRMAQNHPSVVMYSMNHNALSYRGSRDPDKIDGLHNEQGEVGPRTSDNAKQGLLCQSIVERLDPTRVVYHHSSGNLGNMHTLNLYLGFAPIQEISDHFEHWATEGAKPLFLCEYLSPYPLDWTMYRGWYEGKRSFGSSPVPWEFCMGEWNAQFLGDRGFNLNEYDKTSLRWEANKWRTTKTWLRWTYPYSIVRSSSLGYDDQEEVWSMFTTDNWRAFRTHGVSTMNVFGYGPFWKLRDGVNKDRKNLKVDWENLQRPGFSADYIEERYTRMDQAFDRSDWTLTIAGKALVRNNMPLLAYIAGKPEHFTSKEHNYLPGETFGKQVVLINNSRETVTCDTSWSLALPQPIRGTKKTTIETGNQERIPLEFALPATLGHGAYDITMTAQFSTGETQEDTFTIHVLPRAQTLKSGTKVALFDPGRETARLLEHVGLACEPVEADADLSGFDMLIIGRQAITLDGQAPDVSRVRDGLKVIMFEQTAEVLEKRFGFRVQEYGLRRAFKRIPDHPVLAGIETEHLRDWRGEATILPERLVNYEPHPYSGTPRVEWCGIKVARCYRAGNWGSVSSVLIEKPARGDFLPIVDGGFSLQYSPLMVYREGKGIMLLCQMDVSGRTDAEPVAARLAANMVTYVSSYTPAPHRTLLYAGEAAGRTHLQQAGFNVGTYDGGTPATDQVLAVGPGGGESLAAHADAIRTWIKGGGHLLALGLAGREAGTFLPFSVHTEEREHICSVFDRPGTQSLLAGVGPADVHNRDPRKIELVSGGADVVGNGVLAKALDANVVFCQMVPWQFDYKKYYNQKRTYRRTSYLVSRVLSNMGCRSTTPLLEYCAGPLAESERKDRWLEGFYLDTPEEFDDPYRYFPW